MSDGKIVFSTELDNKGLEKELASLKKKIQSLEDQLESDKNAKALLEEPAKQLTAQLDAAKSKLHEMKTAADGVFSKEQLTDQKETVASLQSQWNDVQGKMESYDKSIQTATAELAKNKDRAGEVTEQLAKVSPAAKKMATAMAKAEKSARRFELRLREVLRSALIFSLITQSLAKFREWMGKVIATNDEARASISRLKGALLMLAQPIVDFVVPALTILADLLGTVVYILATLFSAAQGKTMEETAEAAKGLHEETEALEGVGQAAKKATKSLASFDEINRLTEEHASGGASGIKPDFSTMGFDKLPGLLKDLVFDLEAKIRDLRFSWDNQNLHQNKDAWIVALSGILGAVLGGMFGGLNGSVIGLLLGMSIGLIACTFLDKLENPDAAKDALIVALGAMLGAVLGAMFGGLTGAVIGLLLGASISIISLRFTQGEGGGWDPENTVIIVLSAIIGAILGSVFGGIAGGVIGFLLGAMISFVAIEFSEGDFNKDAAIASLRIVLFSILGLVLGAMFGGLAGGVVGLILGMTIGFASVSFDDSIEGAAKTKAQQALKIALTTIIGALIGAVFGGGVFGGIIGGVIGLTFGLGVTLAGASIDNKTGLGGGTSRSSAAMASVPGLATGAVIPPNREFLAVLGDQKSGVNIETPLETMVSAFKQAMQETGGNGGGNTTVILELDRTQFGKATFKAYNSESRRVGVDLTEV